MENEEKKKNLSNGTSWFIWGGAFGLLALTSGNNIVYIVFGIICGLLIFMGLKKRKAFDALYLENTPEEPNQEITEPVALLDDAKFNVIPEEKIDESNIPEDH